MIIRTAVLASSKGSVRPRTAQKSLIKLACDKSGALICDYFHTETVPSRLAFVWADLAFELLCSCKHRLLRRPGNIEKILDRELCRLFASYRPRLHRYRKSAVSNKLI